MGQTDPFVELKARQREMWGSFTPTATFTTPVAAHLVRFADIQRGERVLDVATGTGVVAITVVTSEFGHMFAPRPEVAVAEMRRVLKPGGRIALAAWPPEHLVGRIIEFIGRISPPSPAGVAQPAQWGDPATVAGRLAADFEMPFFARGVMLYPALSIKHYLLFMKKAIGSMQKVMEKLAGDPEKLAALRGEFEALARPYFADNLVRQDYLLTRAMAR